MRPNVFIDVYNLHADAGRGKGNNRARLANIAQLIKYVLAKSEGHTIIIDGDTNLTRMAPEDAPLLNDLLQELQLTETCPYLGCGIDTVDRFYFQNNDKVEINVTNWRYADEFVDHKIRDLWEP